MTEIDVPYSKETEIPRTFEMKEAPHPSEVEATTIIEVTLETVTKATTI